MNTLDLGLIGNCRTSALIDRAGAIVWWCYPYFDSDPLCCALLEPHPDPKRPDRPYGMIDLQFDAQKWCHRRMKIIPQS